MKVLHLKSFGIHVVDDDGHFNVNVKLFQFKN